MNQFFKHIPVYCVVTLAFLVPSVSHAQSPKEKKAEQAALNLQTLQDFRSAERAEAQKPVTTLQEKHRAAVEKYQIEAKAEGNLKSWQAADLALKDLDAGRSILLSEDAGVAKLETDYLTRRKTAETERDKALAKIDQDYLASLEAIPKPLS